eukprot:gene5083-19901_t
MARLNGDYDETPPLVDPPACGNVGGGDGLNFEWLGSRTIATYISTTPVPRLRHHPCGKARNAVAHTLNGNGGGDGMQTDPPASAAAKTSSKSRNGMKAKKGNASAAPNSAGKEKRKGTAMPAGSGPYAAAAFFAATVQRLSKLSLTEPCRKEAFRAAASAAARISAPLPAPAPLPPSPPPPPAPPTDAATDATPAPARPRSKSSRRRARRRRRQAKLEKDSSRGESPPAPAGSAAETQVIAKDSFGIPLSLPDLRRCATPELEKICDDVIRHASETGDDIFLAPGTQGRGPLALYEVAEELCSRDLAVKADELLELLDGFDAGHEEEAECPPAPASADAAVGAPPMMRHPPPNQKRGAVPRPPPAEGAAAAVAADVAATAAGGGMTDGGTSDPRFAGGNMLRAEVRDPWVLL